MDPKSEITPFGRIIKGIEQRRPPPPPQLPPPPRLGPVVIESLAEFVPANPTPPQPLSPVVAPAPLPNAALEHSSDGSADEQQLAKKLRDLQAAHEDLYNKAAALQTNHDDLANQLADARAQLLRGQQEKTNVESQLRDQTAIANDLNRRAGSSNRYVASLRNKLTESEESDRQGRLSVANLQRDLQQQQQRSRTLLAERDNATTDVALANTKVDKLVKQLKLRDRNDEAYSFMQHIQKELADQFAEAGTDFTPDNVVGHIRRASQQAAINRNVSADSNDSSQQNSTTRRGLGTRTTSNIAQELEDAEKSDDSGDEGGSEGIRVPKQRDSDNSRTSRQEFVNQAQQILVLKKSEGKQKAAIAEQAQKIAGLQEQIKKLEADHKAKVSQKQKETHATIKRLQQKIDDLQQHANSSSNSAQTTTSSTQATTDSSAQTITEQSQKIADLENQITRLEGDHKAKLDKLQKEFETTIRSLTKNIDIMKLPTSKIYTTSDVDSIKNDHKVELSKLQAEHEKQIGGLQQTINGSRLQLSKLREKYSDLEKNLNNEVSKRPTQTPPIEIERRIEVIRDASIFEAFRRSPASQQFFFGLGILFLLWFSLYFGIQGYRLDSMWLAANENAIHHLRYTQANRAILGKFSALLENMVGYDSRLLG